MSRTRAAAIVIALVPIGLLGSTSGASAAPDPSEIGTCLTESAGDLTALVDPSAPGVPSEVPAVHCLQP